LGLFASGLSPAEEQQIFTNNVPKEILQSAKTAVFLGGIFDPNKAGFAERLIMKVAAKQSEYTNTIDDGKIEQFIMNVK
jgi:thiamine kinase-like enzyme